MAFSLMGKGGRGGVSDGGAGAARFGILAEVRAYWEGLREAGALPRRDQIDPRGIAGALEQTFLLERVAPGQARFRLAGMQLHDLMGMDVRGMPLTAMFEPAARTRLVTAMEGVFAGPGIAEVWLEAERGIGRPALEGRMILLPLVSSRGTVDLALGCLATEGQFGRAPRRFAISALMAETLEPQAVTARQHDMIAAHPQSVQAMQEPGAEYLAPRPPRSKPMLRLVSSRD